MSYPSLTRSREKIGPRPCEISRRRWPLRKTWLTTRYIAKSYSCFERTTWFGPKNHKVDESVRNIKEIGLSGTRVIRWNVNLTLTSLLWIFPFQYQLIIWFYWPAIMFSVNLRDRKTHRFIVEQCFTVLILTAFNHFLFSISFETFKTLTNT